MLRKKFGCSLTRRIRTWWHQMETFSTLLALWAGISPVISEFHSQRPVTLSFDVFFDLCLNKNLSKQSRRSDLRSLNCQFLTHWGRVTHICVSKHTIIGSDNGLSPDRRQAIIWTNAGLVLIGPLGTNFSEILNEILTFSFKKMRLKVSSAKRRPFCLGLNVLLVTLFPVIAIHFLYQLATSYSVHYIEW